MEPIYSEHIRINLTPLAQKVIQQDLIIFKAGNTLTENGFINKILLLYIGNYCEDFPLDVSLANLKGLSKEYRLNQKTSEEYNSCIAVINKQNNADYTLLKPTAFFKTIFENYARQPFIVRESLFLKEVIQTIQNAINQNKRVHISTHNRDEDITPYKLVQAREGAFMYLIGFDLDNKVKSIRISHINRLRAFGRTSLLKIDVTNEIDERLAEFGPTFIEEELLEIIVKFKNKQALQSYQYSIIHRPIHSEILDDVENIYKFNCSLKQAQFFFMRFAGSIKILEPKLLRDWLIEQYNDGISFLSE